MRWLLAGFRADALAFEAVELALARGEALGVADVLAVVVPPARSAVPVALRLAVPVPRLRHPRRPHLCGDEEEKDQEDGRNHMARGRLHLLCLRDAGGFARKGRCTPT